jgi:protein O-GlcNAc transferase
MDASDPAQRNPDLYLDLIERCLSNTMAAADIRNEVLERAAAALRDGRPSEAEALCQALVAAKPDFLEALHLLAEVQSSLRRYGEALATCDKALAMRPNDAEMLSKRGWS